MDAQAFWDVIGCYNQETVIVQIALMILIVVILILTYSGKFIIGARMVLGIANLYIGVVFFGYYGTESIQKYFALPLYLCCGILFLYEAWNNKSEQLNKPNGFQIILFVLYGLYPFISCMLGNEFPQMVTYVMPCPIVSLSIAVYAGYSHKNRLLLALLTIWGLTGVKSIIFHAYEDVILLICGIYGVYLLAKEFRVKKEDKFVDAKEKV